MEHLFDNHKDHDHKDHSNRDNSKSRETNALAEGLTREHYLCQMNNIKIWASTRVEKISKTLNKVKSGETIN